MTGEDLLKEKRILIVDDEVDVLETLKELLNTCDIDAATEYEAAKQLLEKNIYDLAILDIMGVRGYELLKIAVQKSIVTLMLTAHALDPENFVKSIKMGAHAYIPKEMISEIKTFIINILEVREQGIETYGAAWYPKLQAFFNLRFGYDWTKKDKDFWRDFERTRF